MGNFGAAMARHKIWTAIAAFFALSVIVYLVNPHAGSTTPAAATSSQTTAPVVYKPTFPPKNLADFRALPLRAFAATGDASEVHQVGASTEGQGSCPARNVYVTVSRVLTGQALEADLSAFFVRSGLIRSQCQAFVFAYHSRRDYLAL
jgi:hypothetical protein